MFAPTIQLWPKKRPNNKLKQQENRCQNGFTPCCWYLHSLWYTPLFLMKKLILEETMPVTTFSARRYQAGRVIPIFTFLIIRLTTIFRPTIVVGWVAAQVQHPVYRARAAENFAACVRKASIVHVCLRHRCETPIELLLQLFHLVNQADHAGLADQGRSVGSARLVWMMRREPSRFLLT